MHKSWLCQTCLEDHSQVSCNLITIEKELKNRKSVQLDKVKLFQDGFEEAYKDAEDCKHQYKRQIEENKLDGQIHQQNFISISTFYIQILNLLSLLLLFI